MTDCNHIYDEYDLCFECNAKRPKRILQMPLSLTAYKRMNANPKRSEAASRGAYTRHIRQKLNWELQKTAMKDGYHGNKRKFIDQHSPAWDSLIGTKWELGDI